MKVNTNQIEWLMERMSGYKIAQLSGVAQQTMSALMNGKRKLENLSIASGHKLTLVADKIQKQLLQDNENLIARAKDDIEKHGEDLKVFEVYDIYGFLSEYFLPEDKDTKEDRYREKMIKDSKTISLKDLLAILEAQKNSFEK